MPLYTPVNTVMLTEIPARPQQEVLFLPIHQSHALPWTGPNKSSQIQTEADQSQLFHLGKSDLKWCHFLRKYRSCTCLVVKKKKKKGYYVQRVLMLLEYKCSYAEMQTRRSSQRAVEKTASSRAFQDCADSLESSRDAERARAAPVKTAHKQRCAHWVHPAENFLAINKELLEVHFVLWQNSRTAC